MQLVITWNFDILTATFPSHIDILIIIEVLQSNKPLWDFDLILQFNFHNI